MTGHQLPFHIRILKAELEKRKDRNRRYSMRAFANFLEMDPSALSRVLSGKLDLSLQASCLILKKLDLNAVDARLFVAAVSEDKRNRAAAVLTRALDPSLLADVEFDPRFELIVTPPENVGLTPKDGLSISNDIISVMDLSGRFLHVNLTTAKRLLRVPCELVGETWNDTEVGEQAANILESQQDDFLKSGVEKIFTFSLGEGAATRYFTRLISPIFQQDGTMLAFASTIRDVTIDQLLWIANDQLLASTSEEDLFKILVSSAAPIASSCTLLLDESAGESSYTALSESQESVSMSYKMIVPLKEPGSDSELGRLILSNPAPFSTAAGQFAERLARSAVLIMTSRSRNQQRA
ncbi:MAG: hypothetical protein EOP05_07165 [Proteobacteria bacterium]|nr:MAG: hypothetical protein EOP05_07165 [Pseudomonadota bacterium]